MKVLAIIDVVAGADMERVRAKIADELRGSWALFASGVLREAYATAKPTRVLFVLEAENAAQADEQLEHHQQHGGADESGRLGRDEGGPAGAGEQ